MSRLRLVLVQRSELRLIGVFIHRKRPAPALTLRRIPGWVLCGGRTLLAIPGGGRGGACLVSLRGRGEGGDRLVRAAGNPTPETRNPKPLTLNPKPGPLNPKP